MKLSLIMVVMLTWTGVVSAEKSRSLDTIDSKKVEVKESANKPKAVVELVDDKAGTVTVYTMGSMDKRISSGELNKLKGEAKEKAISEINLTVEKEGTKLATYDIPKRSMDKDAATSACYLFGRRYWAYRGGYYGGGYYGGNYCGSGYYGGGYYGGNYCGSGYYGGGYNYGCATACVTPVVSPIVVQPIVNQVIAPVATPYYGGYFGGYATATTYWTYPNSYYTPMAYGGSAYYWSNNL